MSMVASSVSKKTKRTFQSQKIYIQKFGKVANHDIPILEKMMVHYFAGFGQIIDKKILSNGNLIRLQRALRNYHFYGRGISS